MASTGAFIARAPCAKMAGRVPPWRVVCAFALLYRFALYTLGMIANAPKLPGVSRLPEEAFRRASHNYLLCLRICHNRASRTVQICFVQADSHLRSIWYRWQPAHAHAHVPAARAKHLHPRRGLHAVMRKLRLKDTCGWQGLQLLSIRPSKVYIGLNRTRVSVTTPLCSIPAGPAVLLRADGSKACGASFIAGACHSVLGMRSHHPLQHQQRPDSCYKARVSQRVPPTPYVPARNVTFGEHLIKQAHKVPILAVGQP